MTAVLEDLRSLTEDELARLRDSGDDDTRAAVMAECERRDRSRAASTRARRYWRERSQPGGWLEAAHAQYTAAEGVTNGYMLSDWGKQHIRGEVFPALWEVPEREIGRYITEELDQFFRGSPRLTAKEYWRQIEASDADEYETACREHAEAKGTETRDMGLGYMAVRAGVRAAQNASQHPGGQGMTQEEYKQRTAATRERIATQAAVRAVRAQATREAHQAVATREASEAAQPVTGTVTAPAPRQMPDAPLLLRRLLEEIGLLLTDYVEFPSRSAAIAVVLWIAQAAARDPDGQPVWRAFPRLLLTSRQNGSGKSTVGDFIAELLECRAGRMSKVTAYGLTKVFGGLKETAIADDAQNVFRSDKAGAELLSILINGYSQKATWVSGKNDGKVEKAAGQAVIIGKDELLTKRGEYLADLFARSVIVRMERPACYMPEVDEEADARAETLARALKAIMGALLPQLREASKELATENRGQVITDGDGGRNAQIWRPLLAVARVAGDRWPEAAELAMTELAAASGDLLAAEDALADLELPVTSGTRRSFWDNGSGETAG